MAGAVAATAVVDQRGASAALAQRSGLSARTIVQVNHTATIAHRNKPIHGCSGASGDGPPRVALLREAGRALHRNRSASSGFPTIPYAFLYAWTTTSRAVA